MSFASRETSTYSGQPFELYLFESGTEFWALTSGDKARSYNSKLYTPETITRSEIEQNQETRSGEIEVSIPKTHDLALRFVSYVPTSPVSLVIYRGHDGDADVVANFTGAVANAEFGEECVLHVSSETGLLRKRVPSQKYQNQCNWCVFSPGCGVDKTLFRVQGTLSSVNGDTIKSAAFATKPNGWLNAGYVEVGLDRRMVLSHTGDTVVLIAGIAGLNVGDAVTGYAGCSRLSSDCRTKFNNLPRFRGFDKIPTRNPFDGGLL